MGKRALILAGGGLKVAHQAGVLQVLLDEANLEFDMADGTSGGTFNLAMWCQGMSGTQIADNWRAFSPKRGVSLNLPGGLLGPFGPGLFSFDKYRHPVFDEDWGLDLDALPKTRRKARFNVFNFTDQVLEAREPADMDVDVLVACNSLPFWFPPVKGIPMAAARKPAGTRKTLVDAVYVTDANVEQAIADGATEIHVIWTLSERGVWRNGFWQQYFQSIEESGNGALKRIEARVEASNKAIRNHKRGEFSHHIDLWVLRAEVPLNYIFNFSRDRMTAAVELGVRAGRAYCDEHHIRHEPLPAPLPPPDPQSPGLTFDDSMEGTLDTGEGMTLEMSATIAEIGTFVADPDHRAYVGGHVVCDVFGGSRPITVGWLDLLVFDKDPGDSRMHYVLQFTDLETQQPRTLIGDKFVSDSRSSGMWKDTTTLHLTIWAGHLSEEPKDGTQPVASGQVEVSPVGFLKQQLSMRPQVAGFPDSRLAVLIRFYGFFLGRLWDVYAQKLLPWSPF